MAPNKKQNRKHNEHTRGQIRGCKNQQSSMQKPGIPPARIPEITMSSRPGMTFTLTLWSKHRQRRVATKVVRNERTVKQEGETWSSVKKTAKLRHSGHTQSPLSSSFPSISIMGAVVCGKYQCTSALASRLHGMGDYAHHQCVFLLPAPVAFRRVTTWGLPVDQRGIEPPPAVCPRRQERRPTNWAAGTPYTHHQCVVISVR